MRERGADVGHSKDINEQFAELVHPWRNPLYLVEERIIPGMFGEVGVGIDDRADTGGLGRDDDVVAREGRDEAPGEPEGLGAVPRVQVHLSTAGLLEREDDLVAKPLEYPDDRFSGVGKDRVVHAGDEQGDLHPAHANGARATRAVLTRARGTASSVTTSGYDRTAFGV